MIIKLIGGVFQFHFSVLVLKKTFSRDPESVFYLDGSCNVCGHCWSNF